MLGYLVIAIGVAGMIFGLLMLLQWTGSMQRWFDPALYGRVGDTKNERQFLHLYFISTVLAPLLGGAILIVFGLRAVL